MRHYFGYITAYGWCFITAFSMLLTSEISQRLSPFVVCFFTFSLSTVIFIIYNAANVRTLWPRLIEKKVMVPVLGINLSSFAGWGLMIYPLTYLQPTLVATLILGINPIVTVFITRFFLKQSSPPKLVVTSFLLFLVIILLTVRTLQGENAIVGSTQIHIVLALICCCLSGIATSVNNVLTKKIMVNGFGITDVMCLRFYLTIIVSGIISFTTQTISLNQPMFISILLTTLFFVIVPLTLLQLALKTLDPLRVSIISPLMPVIVVLMQLYGSRNVIPVTTLCATLLTWLLVTFGTYLAIRKS